jgi:hypothetical protein
MRCRALADTIGQQMHGAGTPRQEI